MPKKHEYLVGLDLGSHQTRCVVGLEENSRLRFISYGTAPARGWHRGVVGDQEMVLAAVEGAVEQAEKNGGLLIESAVVGVGGAHVTSNVSHTYVNLPSWEPAVQASHVDSVVRAAAQVPLRDDRTVLQVVPLEFAVDQQGGLRRPVGLPGSRLDAHVMVITAAAQAHNHVRAVVNRAGIVVEETVFEAFAAGHAVLEEQEREMGVAVADLGGGSSEVVAYHDGDLRLATAVAVGGEHFVQDVATVLRTSRDHARALIEQYGCAVAEQTSSNVMIEVPGLRDGESESKSRRLLNEVIEARAEELFDLISKELRRAGMESGRLVSGVVLTGGLAALAGLCDVAERVIDCSSRIGLPPRLEDLPEELDDPSWSAAIGLLLYSQRLRQRRPKRRDRVTEWLRAIFE